jgi:predicted lipoprotein
MRSAVLGTSVIALAFLLCGAAPAPVMPAPEITVHLIDDYLVPRFAKLDRETKALADDLAAGCAGDKARLDRARGNFERTVIAWAGVEFLRFGPMGVTGRPERFSYWPDPRGVTSRQMQALISRRDPSALDAAMLEKKSAAVQGLTVLEALLTDKEHPLDGADEESRYRCGFAVAVARNLSGISGALLGEWNGDDGWRNRMLHPGPDNQSYKSAAEPPSEFARALITGLQMVQDREVAPLIAAEASPGKPLMLPFKRSGLEAPYAAEGIGSLKQLYGLLGLAKFAPKDKAWMPDWIATAFNRLAADAPAAIKAAPGSVDVKERERQLRMLRFHLDGIRKIVGRELAPDAGLTVGFNELDGD